MKRFLLSLLAVAVAAGVMAQKPLMVRMSLVGPPVHILRMQSVQQDLQLTPAQQTKLRGIIPATGQPMDTLEPVYGRIKAVLTRPQITRLEQIHRQLFGFRTLSYKPYQTQVGASDDQVQRITEASNSATQQVIAKKALPSGSGRLQISISAEEQAQISRQVDAAARKVLTKAQYAKWVQMLGKPFRGVKH